SAMRTGRLLASPVEMSYPSFSHREQVTIWLSALQGSMPREEATWVARNFSSNYQMPTGSIFLAVSQAHEEQEALGITANLQSHHLLEQIRKSFDHNLGVLADVVVVETRVADVVMPDRVKRQVHEVLHYARHARTVFDDWGFRKRSPHGNALSVLLSGPPGTGKTFLAGALANELGKVLYKVDLSRVVDKYIGETEKNLGRIFDEASKAQAVLLFDEADSLFAKRTQVKSSNDRYANLEVNYLLQRLESYNGVSLLTTNFEKGIDEAFQRRIRFTINFPMPERAERARLWKHLIPPNAPLEDDIDWTVLGESFEMSGGHIRNATLRAAVRCAARNRCITMNALLRAGVDEMREMGSLVRLGFEIPDEDDESKL
ncbi:MAG: ATP-binding protein, partial [Myxococcota bacterium]